MTKGCTRPQPGCAAKSNGAVNWYSPGPGRGTYTGCVAASAPSPWRRFIVARAAAWPVAMPAALAAPSRTVSSARP